MKLYVRTLTLFNIHVWLTNLVTFMKVKSVVEKKKRVLYCVQFCCLHYIFWANEVKESRRSIIIVLRVHFVTSKYVNCLCLFHVSWWACMSATFNLCGKLFNIILCSFRKSFVFYSVWQVTTCLQQRHLQYFLYLLQCSSQLEPYHMLSGALLRLVLAVENFR